MLGTALPSVARGRRMVARRRGVLALTPAGRLLVVAPVLPGVAALFAVRSGHDRVAMILGFPSFALFLLAIVLLVDRRGAYFPTFRGGIDPTFLVAHRDVGATECRLLPQGIEVTTQGGTTETIEIEDVGSVRTSETSDGRGEVDLVVVDVVGDEILRLRGRTDDERRGVALFVADVERALHARRR